MATIVEELDRDHRNLRALFQVLERQLSLLRAGGDVDFTLIESVLDYCQSYGDRCHHPTEDLVYAALERDSGTIGDLSRDLHTEHRSLAELTATFREMLEDVLGGGVLPRDRLILVAERFLADYRNHMHLEEQFLFPAARRLLGSADWDRIAEQSERISDPLFSEQVETRFEALREYIRGMDRASVPPES